MTRDDDLVNAVKRDWRTANLSTRERAILSFCQKLTLTPSAVSATDAEALRDATLDDASFLSVVMVTAFFQMATRIADGLGVDLDDELTRGTEAYRRFVARGS